MQIIEGKFTSKAATWFWETSKGGKVYLVIGFDLEIVGEDETPQITTVYGRMHFTDATWQRSMESLRAMGFGGDDLQAVYTDDSGCYGGLNTNDVSVTVEMGEPNDKGLSYPEVKWINALGKKWTPRNAPDADVMASFAAQMKARLASTGQTQATSQPATRISAQPVAQSVHRTVAHRPAPAPAPRNAAAPARTPASRPAPAPIGANGDVGIPPPPF